MKLSLQIFIYVFLSAMLGDAQFTNAYINQEYRVLGVESGPPIYMYRDTLYFKLNTAKVILIKAPKGYLSTNDTGLIVVSDSISWNGISNKPIIISAETDPIWNMDKPSYSTTASIASAYYNKTQSDARYLQSFTESDPVWNSDKASYSTSAAIASGYYSKSLSDARYLQAEVDGSISNEIQNLSLVGNALSISGGTGVNLLTTNVNEGGSLYYTDARARGSIVLTTTGSGAASYNSATGALNVPTSLSGIKLYNKSGLVSSSAVAFTDTFSVVSATPTIDLSSYISAAGKTSCLVTSATGFRTSATTGNSPNVSFTGYSTTGVPLIFNQTNTSTVTILGISVLSGLPTILTPDPTNVKVVINAYFY